MSERLFKTTSRCVNAGLEGGLERGSVTTFIGGRGPDERNVCLALSANIARNAFAKGEKVFFARRPRSRRERDKLVNFDSSVCGEQVGEAGTYCSCLMPELFSSLSFPLLLYKLKLSGVRPDIAVIEVTDTTLSHSNTKARLKWLKLLASKLDMAVLLVSTVYMAEECLDAKVPVYSISKISDEDVFSLYKKEPPSVSSDERNPRPGLVFEWDDPGTAKLSPALDLFEALADCEAVRGSFGGRPNLVLNTCRLSQAFQDHLERKCGLDLSRDGNDTRPWRYSKLLLRAATDSSFFEACMGWIGAVGMPVGEMFVGNEGYRRKAAVKLLGTLSYGIYKEQPDDPLEDIVFDLMRLTTLWNRALSADGIVIDYGKAPDDVLHAVGRDCGMEAKVKAFYHGVPVEDLLA